MIKYIIEIIKLQSSVILPGFGSLMMGNSKSGTIVFNALLKFNDGGLAKFISEKEGINQQDAQNQVAKFIREIEAELAKGNSFAMFEFGKFDKNKAGEIVFTQEGTLVVEDGNTKKEIPKKVEKEIAKKESPKEEPKKVQPAPAKKETLKEEPKKVEPTPAKKEEPIDAKKVEPVAAKVEPKKEEKIEIKKPEVKVEEKKAETIESKQGKNSFNPGDDKTKEVEKSIAKPEVKTPEISKNIPLAEASKKEPAAQDKNKFVPPVVDKIVSAIDDKKVPEKVAASYNKEEKKAEENVADKKQSVKEKFRKDKPQKVKNQVPKDKKKKSKLPLIIILIILIGGGGTAGFLFQDEIKHFLFAGVGNDSDSTHNETHQKDSLQHSNVVIEEPIVEDTVVAEPIIEEPIVEEVVKPEKEKPVVNKPVKEKPVVNTSSPGGTYHIIGNSFSSKSNADNYASTMSGKGYAATVLGKFDGLYLVSIKSYGSREDAKAGLSSVQSDAASAWVFKYK